MRKTRFFIIGVWFVSMVSVPVICRADNRMLSEYVGKRLSYCHKIIGARNGPQLSKELLHFFDLADQQQWRRIADGALSDFIGNESGANGDLWCPVNEIYYACKMYTSLSKDEIGFYTSEIKASLSSTNCIILTGTDAGRYLLGPFFESKEDMQVYVISANSLIDERYEKYIQLLYGTDVNLPTQEDMDRCAGKVFSEYGRMLDIQTIMRVNFELCKTLLCLNEDSYTLYMDEYYSSLWVYDHSLPAGVLLEITSTSTMPSWLNQLKNRWLWKKIEKRLNAMPSDSQLLLVFAKLRNAQGGLFASKKLYKQGGACFRQAARISPSTPESYVRLCLQVLFPSRKFEEAEEVIIQARDNCGNIDAFDRIADLLRERATH